MNLAKVALYLEYIAFCLRYHFDPDTIPELKERDVSKRPTDVEEILNGADAKPADPKVPRQGVAANPTLRVVAKMERLLKQIPPAQRVWALSFLWSEEGQVPLKTLVEMILDGRTRE